ncbi:MAG: flagellar basal body P-ring protein FlgI [Campylobacterota bacterium]
MKYIFLVLFLFSQLFSQTIKDISNIIGIRDNQLIGYGLVVGLAGTGDKSKFTMQSLQNLLRNSYIKIPAGSINSKNIAAVMVTAKLPPFSRQGDKIKVKVSTIGDAKSLNHGELLITQLKGVDGKVYALAQGTIVANTDNETSGFIYDGATVENEVAYDLRDEDSIRLSLLKSSASDADLVQTKINDKFGKRLAFALDTRTIEVRKPPEISIVRFISMVQNIPLGSTFKKKIIIDMNRKTVITGGDVPVEPVTVARDTFTLRIKKSPLQDDQWDDNKLNRGVDVGDGVKIVDKPIVDMNNARIDTKKQPTVSDLVRAMRVMKVPMDEIIDTLKMVKDLGAIDVEFEIRG